MSKAMGKYQNPIVEQKNTETIHYNSIYAKLLDRQNQSTLVRNLSMFTHGQVNNRKGTRFKKV